MLLAEELFPNLLPANVLNKIFFGLKRFQWRILINLILCRAFLVCKIQTE